MIQYEINRRDTALATAKSTITQQGNTITQQGNTITTLQANNAALQAKLAVYERKYELLFNILSKKSNYCSVY